MIDATAINFARIPERSAPLPLRELQNQARRPGNLDRKSGTNLHFHAELKVAGLVSGIVWLQFNLNCLKEPTATVSGAEMEVSASSESSPIHSLSAIN